MAELAKLSDKQIAQGLAKLNGSSRTERGWRRKRNTITKEFILKSFTGATGFLAKIAPIANAMDHHPDAELYKYKRVKISLTSHSAGGLTRNDFALAAKIDRLAPTSESGRT